MSKPGQPELTGHEKAGPMSRLVYCVLVHSPPLNEAPCEGPFFKTGLVRLAVADRHPRLLQGQHPSQLVTAVVGSSHPAGLAVVAG